MHYQEIKKRMDKLASKPVRHVRKDVMETIVADMRKKTPKSAKMFEAARKVIPGGCEHMLSHTVPYPVFIDRGDGAYLYDVDGNKYVDFLNGGGPVLLGHNPPAVIEKIIDLLRTKGSFHGLCDEYETLAAEKITQHMPAVQKIRFLQSGTEADMAAIRLARAYNGKKKIIKFRGTYHGWSDQLVVDLWVPKSGRFMSHGIPESVTENTVIVPLNDIAALERAIEENEKDGIAAVLVEPLGAESGTIPINEDFHKELRRITRENDIVLIFDEVVTGFRLGMSGAQGYFGVDPEITVFGKIMGGCFPSSGAIGGKAEIMDILNLGIMSGGPSCFVAGTVAANPLSCAATYHTICEIERTGAIEKAAATTDRLVGELNELFEDRNSPFFAYNYASIIHIETAAALHIDIDSENAMPQIFERKTAMTDYQTFLRGEGLMTLMGKGFVTSAHGEPEIKATVEGYNNLLNAL
ncbi:MAG: aminotransferase class III-fold pyridoxal phosphate-dependent enzyme [Candidatus Lindowbacteria bacterium]|nr:aminotransferase class III-fold pyridoxal phosphate-dependent enzyme [Candidatus Lindowbacteria bacterium]